MRWPAMVKAWPEPGGIEERAVTGWRWGMDGGRGLFHGDADGKCFRFTGRDQMQAKFVLGGIGRSHPRFDAVIRRIVAAAPGDDGGVGGRHLGVVEAHNDVARPALFAEDHLVAALAGAARA